MRAEDIPAVAADGGQNVLLGEPFLQMVAPADDGGRIQFDLNALPDGGLALFATILADEDIAGEYVPTYVCATFPQDMNPDVAASMLRYIGISDPTGGSLYDSVAGDADDE